MSSVEDLALRNIEREERQNKNNFVNNKQQAGDRGKTKKVGGTALTDRKTEVGKRLQRLKDDGWGEIWSEGKLIHVANSEYDSLLKFGKSKNAKNAEVLEVLTNYGISHLRWLGNFPKDGKVHFKAFCCSAREFDDKRHRIDSVATLSLGKTVRERFPPVGNKIEIGIDATTWKKDEQLPKEAAEVQAKRYFAEKISRSNNENDTFQKPLPFGFSQLDFYTNPWRNEETGKHDKKKIGMIPRFVIGINGEIADSIRQYDFDYDEKRKKFSPKSESVVNDDPRTVLAQFKILSEINKQAEMMIKMMPKDYEKRSDLVLAMKKLEVIKHLTDEALKKSAKLTIETMNRKGILPEDIKKELDGKDEEEKVIILENMFRDPKRKDNDFHYDPTYDGIMSAADSFIECAEDDDASDELRKMQTRNKAVVFENKRIKAIEHSSY